jgi:hypothetical protein
MGWLRIRYERKYGEGSFGAEQKDRHIAHRRSQLELVESTASAGCGGMVSP